MEGEWKLEGEILNGSEIEFEWNQRSRMEEVQN